MTSPPPRESFRDTWKRERIEQQEALQALEEDEERVEEVLSMEESLERSRARTYRDPKGYCLVHQRFLSYPEFTGTGCRWCRHGSREKYAAYLDATNIGKDGRRRKAGATKTIS